MRRPAPTLPISPQQLKHFAAATVAITVLLALFAGGDGAGLADEIKAREAQSKLAMTEAAKFGAKPLKANLKLKNGAKSQFAFSEGGEVVDTSSEWGSGGGGGTVRPTSHGVSDASSIQHKLPKTPGESVAITGAEGVPDGAKPEANRAKKKPAKTVEKQPTATPAEEDLDKAMEASRQRSGQQGASSD